MFQHSKSNKGAIGFTVCHNPYMPGKGPIEFISLDITDAILYSFLELPLRLSHMVGFTSTGEQIYYACCVTVHKMFNFVQISIRESNLTPLNNPRAGFAVIAFQKTCHFLYISNCFRKSLWSGPKSMDFQEIYTLHKMYTGYYQWMALVFFFV